ncbi:hypothetical protein RDI58_024177 [Solanum bulbocastanum]|uniref:Uncharacterized protein n=1 Tax=Solanum bulbocastanum TaxID=147425 RepID=A0AAN8Y2P8_SOLBU
MDIKRVEYTSSAATVVGTGSSNIINECSWTDVDAMRAVKPFANSYAISKTITKKAALEFAEKNGNDLVTVIPTWIHGTFITPQTPGSVSSSMEMTLDNVANAHIFLFDNPNAKRRYTWTSTEDLKRSSLSSKRLLETGFKYKYGLEDMYDGAIECCKQREIL